VLHCAELAATALVYLAWVVAGWDEARHVRTRRANLERSRLEAGKH
jgi:hypothetical protein